MTAMGVLLVYAGALTALAGLVAILKPLRFLRIRTRRAGGLVLAMGLGVGLVGAALPARVQRSPGSLLIDRFMPEYHFNEVHSIRIQAPPDTIFRSIRAVTPAEVRWLRTLYWIRSLPARIGGTTSRTSPEPEPILDPEPDSGTVILGEEPGRELLFGLIGQFSKLAGGARPRIEGPQQFLAFHHPDQIKATMGFWLRDEGGGWWRLTTETRVLALDPSTRRKFSAYWRVIYPGSSLLRRTFLAAVKRRAEAAS